MFTLENVYKQIGENFFVWSLPLAIIVLNILDGNRMFDYNVIAAFVIGLIINIIWDIAYLYLNKKEYHKNLL